MNSFIQAFETIEQDTTSGSAALADTLIDVLIEHGSEFSLKDKQIVIEKIELLVSKKPFFAVLRHLSETLKKSEDWSSLKTYKQRFSLIHSKISEQLLSNTGYGPKVYLLHSNSKTITSVFEHIPPGSVGKIYQTMSLPESEGVIQADVLKQFGFDVTLVDDNPPEVIEEVDFFVTGADLILPQYLINKTGTLNLAEKINQLDKPYLVLADERKFADVQLQTLPVTFERVPKMLITKIITGVEP